MSNINLPQKKWASKKNNVTTMSVSECVCVWTKSTWRRTAVIELRCDPCKFWQRDFRVGDHRLPTANKGRCYSPLVGRWICFWVLAYFKVLLLLVSGRVVRLSVQFVESCIQWTWSQLILLIQAMQWMSIDIVKQLPVGNATMNCFMPVGNPKFS